MLIGKQLQNQKMEPEKQQQKHKNEEKLGHSSRIAQCNHARIFSFYKKISNKCFFFASCLFIICVVKWMDLNGKINIKIIAHLYGKHYSIHTHASGRRSWCSHYFYVSENRKIFLLHNWMKWRTLVPMLSCRLSKNDHFRVFFICCTILKKITNLFSIIKKTWRNFSVEKKI